MESQPDENGKQLLWILRWKRRKNEGDNIDRNVISVLQDEDLFFFIDELGIEIKSFTKQHVIAYFELSPPEDHKDPKRSHDHSPSHSR